MSAEFDELKAAVESLMHENEESRKKIAELEQRINDGTAENKKLHDRVSALSGGDNPDAEAMKELTEEVKHHADESAAVSKPDPLLNPAAQPKAATNPLGGPEEAGPKTDAFSAKPKPVEDKSDAAPSKKGK